jgi:SAM-dependent methyltransferase
MRPLVEATKGFGVRRQREALAKIDPSAVPSGPRVPEEVWATYFPSEAQIIFNAGCGTGGRQDLLKDRVVIGWDINPQAVTGTNLRQPEQVAHVYDVTGLDFPDFPLQPCVWMEHANVILAEGLWGSLIKTQTQDHLAVANFYLRPGGSLLMADYLQMTELAKLTDYYLPIPDAEEWRRRWERRFDENRKLGLPYGTCVAAQPGAESAKQWGQADDLRQLEASENFAGYTRHYKLADVERSVGRAGLILVDSNATVFSSETGEPLLGFWAVAQKPDPYLFTPALAGQPGAMAVRGEDYRAGVKDMGRDNPRSFEAWYYPHLIGDLNRNLPGWRNLGPEFGHALDRVSSRAQRR